MTEEMWRKSIGCDNDSSHSMAVVTATAKGAEKVDVLKKMSVPDDVAKLCSDEGVFDDINDLAQLLRVKQSTSEQAETQQPAAQASVVGERAAAKNELCDLLADDYQVGRRRGLPAHHAPQAGHGKVPRTATPSAGQAARNAAQHAPATPNTVPPQGSPVHTPASSSGVNPAPAGSPSAAGDTEGTTANPASSGLFAQSIDTIVPQLPKRQQDIVRNALAFVKKIAGDDLMNVKSTSANGQVTKISEFLKKAKATMTASVSASLVQLEAVMKALQDFSENQFLPSSQAKKAKQKKSAQVQKVCDSESMYLSLLVFENNHVSIGAYCYRAVWECRFDTFFLAKNYTPLVIMLAIESNGDPAQKFLSLMDLLSRGIPEHEVVEIQTCAIEEKLGTSLAKNYSNDDIDQLVNKFKCVDKILNDKVTEQLVTMTTLLHPQDASREELNTALIQCKGTTGIYHELRYQRKGSELKTNAAKYCGQILGQHLAVGKVERLAVQLQSLDTSFGQESDAFKATRQLYQEIQAQTSGNSTFEMQHSETLQNYVAHAGELSTDWQAKLSVKLEEYVQQLFDESADGDKVIADIGRATSLANAIRLEADAQIGALHDILDEVPQAQQAAADAYCSYVQLHVALGVAAAQLTPAQLSTAAHHFIASKPLELKKPHLQVRCDQVREYYETEIHANTYGILLVARVKSLSDLVSKVCCPRVLLSSAHTELTKPHAEQAVFFASLPSHSEIDTQVIATEFESLAADIRELSRLSSLPIQQRATVFHQNGLRASCVGSLAILQHCCRGLVVMRRIFAMQLSSLDATQLAKQTDATKMIEAHVASIDSFAKAFRELKESNTAVDRATRCGEQFVELTVHSNALAAAASADDAEPGISDISFDNLKWWSACSTQWQNARLEIVRASIGAPKAQLTEWLETVRALHELVVAFQAKHPSYSDTPVAEVTEFLESNVHLKHISQWVYAVNRLATHLKKTCSDLELAQDRKAFIADSDEHISIGIRHSHLVFWEDHSDCFQEATSVQESLIRSAVTLTLGASASVGFVYACLALSRNQPVFAKDVLARIQAKNIKVHDTLLARVRPIASLAPAAITAPAKTPGEARPDA